MRLKSYLQFIKESIEPTQPLDECWKLSEYDIREYLLEFRDEGWYIRVDFGFVNEETKWNYSQTPEKMIIKETFTERVIPNERVRSAYWVELIYNSKVKGTNLTDSLIFVHDILKDITGGEIELRDDVGKLEIEHLVIKDGVFILVDNDESEIEIEGQLGLFIKTPDIFKFTQKQVADYYGWGYDSEGDNISVEIELEDLADYLLNSKSNYKEVLEKGMEIMWDYYESQYYIPEIGSFFQYSLDSVNDKLMVKAIIKEKGGFDEVMNLINVDVKTEDELIEFLLKERFYITLEELCKDSEIYDDITRVVADWEMDAHVSENYNIILSEFDDIVSKEFEFDKIEKDVERTYKVNNEVKKYTEKVTFFKINFDNKWIEKLDLEDLQTFSDIDSIFKEYLGNIDTYDMNPRLSDYGSVNTKALNVEIKSDLERFLNRN